MIDQDNYPNDYYIRPYPMETLNALTPKQVGLVRTFFPMNDNLTIIQLKKFRTSSTCLGVRAFQRCQGVWPYM